MSENKRVDDLIRRLNNPDDEETLSGVFGEPELLDIDDDLIPHEPTIEIWERLLADFECWFRRQIVGVLRELGQPATLDLLRERQDKDSRPVVRTAAETAFRRIVGQP